MKVNKETCYAKYDKAKFFLAFEISSGAVLADRFTSLLLDVDSHINVFGLEYCHIVLVVDRSIGVHFPSCKLGSSTLNSNTSSAAAKDTRLL